MYLDNWMIATLILSFGICAYVSRNRGFMQGATATLQALEEQRFIKINDDGEIKRWTPYTELTAKKSKKRVDKSK